ncbi:hypothetical protein F5Y16DRAFT_417541 [Xylariaceae sp. FL0255]|nr:hypothetical protein F5Y16DRAFT_417541 [Xylariaceae sp. FL0255]
MSPQLLDSEPPVYFLAIQAACKLILGPFWTVAYVLYIKQGFKDKSYGMPMVAVCANIGWELIYGVFYPLSPAETITFVPWFLIDLGIVYTTIKFGSEQWKHAPLVANNLGLIVGIGSVVSFLTHWALIKTCATVEEAAFYSGFGCQVVMGVLCVAQLLHRNHTKGHSWTIWFCRWIGTVGATGLFVLRYLHYPEQYPFAGTPMAMLLFMGSAVADLIYPFIFYKLKKAEGTEKPRLGKKPFSRFLLIK